MPDEIALELYELDVVVVDGLDKLRAPMLAEGRELRAQIDFLGSRHHSSMVIGSSTSFLKAARNSAPMAPSRTRWSTERVQVMTLAMASAAPFTTGRCSPAPTARMAPWG